MIPMPQTFLTRNITSEISTAPLAPILDFIYAVAHLLNPPPTKSTPIIRAGERRGG